MLTNANIKAYYFTPATDTTAEPIRNSKPF